ncbi:aspartyl-tRNA(Asn)/glutamyl-tRNA(Gln) amidotransferase subunit A [Actinocorallia herbida]|uniref:Aspartyl-tRNA(Asn)/glutamyl-tRNA(Gln) amidotransferase subunit A n=1 Tax=Actinocorallia herbida TaxID=58109 RepID=A0A3N1D6D0_9ACTN|nr:amidase [Actinocorallia herbida]ROO88658.1 aspartyl-tRNA(Asn)/glutamyl-tRNA(Gln) amidotransferase subunit A [Actinocorallia herbida]
MSREYSRRVFLAQTSAAAGAAALVASPAKAGGRPLAPSLPDVDVRKAALDDPTEATLAEAAALIRARKLKPTTLVEAHLARIDAFEPTYKAFNAVTRDAALAAAKAQDRRPTGVLAGIPLCVKDNYFTKGVATTANSFVFAGFVPDEDATAVSRLTSAGGIVLGKGQMGPLATTRATTPNGVVTTVNAWTPTNIATDPGGSSTGPATAVAGRLATSAIGTQTGGSIILPANQQNLTGLKPTMGRTSLYGIIPLSFTRDHSGPIARDALDAAIMLTVMSGPDEKDPRTQGLPDLPDLVRAATPVLRKGKPKMRRTTVVGVPADYLTGSAATLRKDFLAVLAGIEGIRLVDIAYPDDWALLTGTFNDARLAERTEPFRPYLQQDLKLFGVSVLSWLQGLLLSGDEWITAQRAKAHLIREVLDGPLDRCDVVLQTSVVPFDILGLPEIGFPIGFNASGVPVGAILGGQPYEEDRLLEVAAAYQAATDWHLRRPVDPPQAGAAARAFAAPLVLTAEEAAAQSA